MLLRPLLIFILLIFALAGCTDLLGTKDSATNNPAKYEDPAKLAKQLESEGRYTDAAKEYQRLATRSGPGTRQSYQLAAIRTFLKADMIDAAKAELSTVRLQDNYGLNEAFELVQIRLALAEQRIDEALAHLNAMDVNRLPKNLQIEHYQLQASVLEVKGDVFGAAQKWIQLDNLIGTDALALRENHKILWDSLALVSYEQLRQIQQIPGDTFSGWVSLAVLSKTIQPSYIAQSIADWQTRYPNHPANKDTVQTLLHATQAKSVVPIPTTQSTQKIALLLPLESKFYYHAEAVQNGMVAVVMDDNQSTTQKYEVVPRPVDVNNVTNVYQQMISEGAKMVIGPLDKESLTVLANSTNQLPVLTVGLNYLDTATNTNNLFQFGLSPEQEAQAVAQRAWQDGHRLAAALVPPGNWSNRVLTAFQQAWAAQGGQFTTVQQYDNENFDQPVKRIIDSKADMVFMLAFPKEARRLRPYFPYHDGDSIAVYSTSHIYSGITNQSMDRDLDGIIFSDIPWILAPDQQAKKWQAHFEQNYPDNMEQVKRLYALGIDAYHIMLELKKLNQYSYLQLNGYTGLLSVGNGGIITRQLLWAKFVDGLPQLLEKQPFQPINSQPVLTPVSSTPNNSVPVTAPVPIPIPVMPVPIGQ